MGGFTKGLIPIVRAHVQALVAVGTDFLPVDGPSFAFHGASCIVPHVPGRDERHGLALGGPSGQ